METKRKKILFVYYVLMFLIGVLIGDAIHQQHYTWTFAGLILLFLGSFSFFYVLGRIVARVVNAYYGEKII